MNTTFTEKTSDFIFDTIETETKPEEINQEEESALRDWFEGYGIRDD